ncbi:sulfatase [Tenacibaculum jejuense]|uniref:Endo-4S-kappa-carrageenan sulfatase, family S1-7 n=1 Tax=Tenacibaculum jejuense TaxID=584609 RepID=A0A238UBL4_9FLAO|nr:sulfatase [Tenacibaculum jejuense]SNR16593.1 endo-4S-kappa-carrageenan sulfatase, family S1-7 [Tenacibaculum jejuense]
MKKTIHLFKLKLLVLGVIFSCKPNDKKVIREVKKTKPNIVFIAVDDLRPELGCYDSDIAITPNIDKLASTGLTFNKAYCQEAICSPSRASLMTGARPESINVIENFKYFRDANPDIVTLPQHFKNNGYETVHTGKIFHKPAFADLDISWSRKPAYEKMTIKKENTPGGYALLENQILFKKNRANVIAKYGKNAPRNGLGKGPAYENADVPDTFYEDGYNAELAIVTLKDLQEKNPDKPFFLGMGMKKPHLDWLAPKKYWDMYDPSKIKLTNQNKAPTDGAAMGLHPSFELRARFGIPKKGPISDDLAKKLKHAYLASISYIDAQIGKLINAINEEGLRENTIIILWSDHGWHLGEMGIWGKATNYEISTRVPLIIATPNMSQEVKGKKSEALVELVDMYPTLADLANLPLPKHLEGQSFKPLLANPNKKWKDAAFSQFPSPALREWAANPLSKGMRETYFGPLIEEVEHKIKTQQKDKWDRNLFENYLMGYAMRTEDYRLIVWKDYRDTNAEPVFIELYDHKTDPNETVNIANKKSELTNTLLAQFNKGWKGNVAR